MIIKSINNKTSEILHIHNTILNASIVLGLPLDRWLVFIAIMIEKEKNNSQINRLRIINLYEADYNLVLKFFWPHKATHLAEESKFLGENTWDARPNCSIEHATFLDEIVTEIHRLTYSKLCKFQDYSVACYDRIVPAHAMICSRKFEVSSSVCQLAAHT